MQKSWCLQPPSVSGTHGVCPDLWAEPLPDLESQQWPVLWPVWRLLPAEDCRIPGQRWQREWWNPSVTQLPIDPMVLNLFLNSTAGVAQHSGTYITDEDQLWYYKHQPVETLLLSILLTPWAVKCTSQCFCSCFVAAEAITFSTSVVYEAFVIILFWIERFPNQNSKHKERKGFVFPFIIFQPEELVYRRSDKAAAAELQGRRVQRPVDAWAFNSAVNTLMV